MPNPAFQNVAGDAAQMMGGDFGQAPAAPEAPTAPPVVQQAPAQQPPVAQPDPLTQQPTAPVEPQTPEETLGRHDHHH